MVDLVFGLVVAGYGRQVPGRVLLAHRARERLVVQTLFSERNGAFVEAKRWRLPVRSSSIAGRPCIRLAAFTSRDAICE
ncbi:hypothetical protein [Streptomyces sp. NPDC006552]|uniref:hypothetical protein n=1 Tax=Streptomyces sp. NPDC006552 TaxID=3157179 RepID=UPI0033AACD34